MGEAIDFTLPRTIGSAVEHHIDIVGVTGSIPVSSTERSGVARIDRPQNEVSHYFCDLRTCIAESKFIAKIIIPITKSGTWLTQTAVIPPATIIRIFATASLRADK